MLCNYTLISSLTFLCQTKGRVNVFVVCMLSVFDHAHTRICQEIPDISPGLLQHRRKGLGLACEPEGVLYPGLGVDFYKRHNIRYRNELLRDKLRPHKQPYHLKS